MAKTIKFNLILDEKPVRTIEELQKNFCINDVFEFYQIGLLQKWLKVRGYEDYLKKVEVISEKNSAIIELIKIFEIEKSEKEIKEAVYSLEFRKERTIELEEWNKKDRKIKEIIADYHNGYDVLKAKILENKAEMPFMKSAAKEIFDKYDKLFRMDFVDFFNNFVNSARLIIYAILMNQDLRNIFLEHKGIAKILSDEFSLKTKPKRELLFSIYSENKEEDISIFLESLGVISYQGATDGYWKDLEVAKTTVMVLSIPEGSFVRNANKPKEELSATDVNGNFLILNGLLYKSNNSQSQIVYMKV